MGRDDDGDASVFSSRLKKLRGAESFRQRIVLSTLSNTPLRIDDIRHKDESPGLQEHEASFLRLVESISDGCVIEINETGTKLRYKPGLLVGGRGISHECGNRRGIGYFLEPLILLALFGKKPLSITLKGVTNDAKDPSVDTFRTVTLPMLKRFGVPIEELELRVVARGAPPDGGGEINLKIPIVQASLNAVHWTDEGMVKRIRGVAYTTRVSPQMNNRMIDAARGLFNKLLPDVRIFSDHVKGAESGRSPGYGVSLVAETTTGCLISAECTAAQKEELPEDVGLQAAMRLLQEIKQGGVVDSTHQGLLFILCALCPEDVSKIRVGKLSPYGIKTLQHIKEFLDVQFNIQPDPGTGTVILKCVGSGFRNVSRKIS